MILILMALFSSLGHKSRAIEQGDLHLTEGQWLLLEEGWVSTLGGDLNIYFQ